MFGIREFQKAIFNPGIMMPHYKVKDITRIDFEKLRLNGIELLVFDKDNTLTIPYKNEIYKPLMDSFKRCWEVYGKNILILSNSSGSTDDEGYKEAIHIENTLQIKVIRHKKKKPAVTHEEIAPDFEPD